MTTPAGPADPIAAVGHPDPWAYYDALARRRPFRDDSGMWVVAAPDDVAAVLTHPAAAVRPPDAPVPPHLAGTAAGAVFGRLIRMRDDADRDTLRRAVEQALAGLSSDGIDSACTRTADRLRTELHPLDGPAIDRWMQRFPVAVLAELCGWPLEWLDTVVESARALAAGFAPGAAADVADAASAGADELQRLATGTHAAGLVALLLEHATGATRDPMVANIAGLFFQTFDATAGLIGSALAQWPHIDVAGVLQMQPPVHNTRRFVTADALVAGMAMVAGDQVLVVLAAASRAGAPTTFAFGAGRHQCPARALVPTIATHGIGAVVDAANGGAMPAMTGLRPSLNSRLPVFSRGCW
jgi:cytochrome P450